MYYLVREKYTKTTDATDLEVIGWADIVTNCEGSVTEWLQSYTRPYPFSAATFGECKAGTHTIPLDARWFSSELRGYDPSLTIAPPGWTENPSEADYAERLLQEYALESMIFDGTYLRDPNSWVLYAAEISSDSVT